MNITNAITPTLNRGVSPQNYNQTKVQLKNDAFVSFKGSSQVIKALDKSITDVVNSNAIDIVTKMKFHKILNKAMPEIMKSENFINKGRDSKVYRINDNFVAKIRRGIYENNAVHAYNVTTCPDKRFTALDFYYGEPIIKLGHVEILKNATPTPNFVHCGTKYRDGHPASIAEITKYEKEVLPVVASLPQESFDTFAKGLKDLNKITTFNRFKKVSFIPDIMNPNNLIIADKKIKLVDQLDKVPFKKPNSIYTMLEPLLYRLSSTTYVPENINLVKPRQEILKKCLIAAEKAELPLESEVVSPYADHFINVLTGNYSASIISEIACKRNSGVSLADRLAYIEKSFS